MKKAIWSTYCRFNSTDERPQHDNCLQGSNSWCSWQRTDTNSQLQEYKHEYKALSKDVLDAFDPIYKDLSQDALLKWYVCGFTQNDNGSYNIV